VVVVVISVPPVALAAVVVLEFTVKVLAVLLVQQDPITVEAVVAVPAVFLALVDPPVAVLPEHMAVVAEV
jgi:hypothetical protein